MVSIPKDPHPVDLRAVSFKEITMIGTRVYTRESYQKALDKDEEMEEKEYLCKFPTAKERKRDWENLYNLMKTNKDMTSEEKSRYWFLNNRMYWRLRSKEGTRKHWIDELITSS